MTPHGRRYLVLTAMALGLLAAGAGAVKQRPWIVYNATDSAPRGFYLITTFDMLSPGEQVAARLPPEAEKLAAERGFLPSGLPVIKTVWAVPGAEICVESRRLSAPGRPDLVALERDFAGRLLPSWKGCRTLDSGEVLLASDAVPHSFDGRYFGPVSTALVLGRARLLWSWDGSLN